MRTFVCMCIQTLVLAVTAASQVPPTSQLQQDDRIIVGTNLVSVNVIATDGDGPLCEVNSTRSHFIPTRQVMMDGTS